MTSCPISIEEEPEFWTILKSPPNRDYEKAVWLAFIADGTDTFYLSRSCAMVHSVAVNSVTVYNYVWNNTMVKFHSAPNKDDIVMVMATLS